jgi:hypothetical protein
VIQPFLPVPVHAWCDLVFLVMSFSERSLRSAGVVSLAFCKWFCFLHANSIRRKFFLFIFLRFYPNTGRSGSRASWFVRRSRRSRHVNPFALTCSAGRTKIHPVTDVGGWLRRGWSLSAPLHDMEIKQVCITCTSTSGGLVCQEQKRWYTGADIAVITCISRPSRSEMNMVTFLFMCAIS